MYTEILSTLRIFVQIHVNLVANIYVHIHVVVCTHVPIDVG